MNAIFTSNPIVIVEKPWGREEWIVNTAFYCCKKLFVLEGHRLSVQYHNLKDETLYLESGVASVVLYDTLALSECREVPLDHQSSLRILPGTIHRIIAHKDSWIIEASTQHRDSDVHRLQDDHGRV